LSNRALCQANPVPAPVSNNFVSMFPEAKNVEWRDKLSDFQVFFMSGHAKCEAKFSLNGKWISTEKQIEKDSIPDKIKETLRSGKYAGWDIQSAYELIFPDQPAQYHIVVIKDNSPKKILFFDYTGQMMKENQSL
jgi:hypothetical protein